MDGGDPNPDESLNSDEGWMRAKRKSVSEAVLAQIGEVGGWVREGGGRHR